MPQLVIPSAAVKLLCGKMTGDVDIMLYKVCCVLWYCYECVLSDNACVCVIIYVPWFIYLHLITYFGGQQSNYHHRPPHLSVVAHTMASKQLLRRLAFRDVQLTLAKPIKSIEVQLVESNATAGQSTARYAVAGSTACMPRASELISQASVRGS